MMEIRLKERLIGATVLVLAAVLFIPMVLDGPGPDRRVSRNVPLPDPVAGGETKTVRIDLDSGRVASDEPSDRQPVSDPGAAPATIDLVPRQEQQQAAAPETAPPAEAARSKPREQATAPKETTASRPPADAPWTVQVGSFSKQDNAESLAARLRDLDFPAYVSRFQDGSGVHFRVRVGGFQTRDDAQRQADALRAKTGGPAQPTPAN